MPVQEEATLQACAVAGQPVAQSAVTNQPIVQSAVTGQPVAQDKTIHQASAMTMWSATGR